jgi:hypothetical protein
MITAFLDGVADHHKAKPTVDDVFQYHFVLKDSKTKMTWGEFFLKLHSPDWAKDSTMAGFVDAMNFEELMGWTAKYAVMLTPCTCVPFVRAQYRRLLATDYDIIGLDELISRTTLTMGEPFTGMYFCSCATHQHWAFCEHVLAFLFHYGICTRFPMRMQPGERAQKQYQKNKKKSTGYKM